MSYPIYHKSVDGLISINPSVISRYAADTALECPGIAGLSANPQGPKNSMKRDSGIQGVEATVDDEGRLLLDFHIIVAYGANIRESARNMASVISQRLEEVTGFEVERINVYVDDIKRVYPDTRNFYSFRNRDYRYSSRYNESFHNSEWDEYDSFWDDIPRRQMSRFYGYDEILESDWVDDFYTDSVPNNNRDYYFEKDIYPKTDSYQKIDYLESDINEPGDLGIIDVEIPEVVFTDDIDYESLSDLEEDDLRFIVQDVTKQSDQDNIKQDDFKQYDFKQDDPKQDDFKQIDLSITSNIVEQFFDEADIDVEPTKEKEMDVYERLIRSNIVHFRLQKV